MGYIKMMAFIRNFVRLFFFTGIGLFVLFPFEAFAADAGNGQKLYMTHCAGCHGSNGISVMPEAPNLASFELFNKPDQDLIDMMLSGSDRMPPYMGILNEGEILDVISYLRTLR